MVTAAAIMAADAAALATAHALPQRRRKTSNKNVFMLLCRTFGASLAMLQGQSGGEGGTFSNVIVSATNARLMVMMMTAIDASIRAVFAAGWEPRAEAGGLRRIEAADAAREVLE